MAVKADYDYYKIMLAKKTMNIPMDETDLLLEECRELMANRMRASMSRMMGRVEDVLFEMATVKGSPDEANHYVEAVREIRMKKREIQVRFENRFMTLYQDSIRNMKSGDPKLSPQAGTDSFAVGLGDYEFDDSSKIQNSIAWTRNECRHALAKLDQHVSHLFEAEDIEQFINPMQPGTVFSAFLESCRDIRTGEDIRYILVDMFEKYVVSDLHAVYDDMNSLFDFYQSSDAPHKLEDDPLPVEDAASQYDRLNDGQPETRKTVMIRIWVMNRLNEKTRDREMPDFVQRFLMHAWRLVLEDTYEKHGEISLEWDRVMQVAEDLVNSTNTAIDRDTRTQQVWMLPGLIYRLKNGMKSISLPLIQQADFLSELKVYHTRMNEMNRFSGSPG